MQHKLAGMILLVVGLLAAGPVFGQVVEVPMKGLGNEWVKQLDLKGRMDWEWVETYPSEVYFVTRQDVAREGDVVTMWTRVEYRDPQLPGPHRSVASRDSWDCATQRRAQLSTLYYKWNNLDDPEPQRSVTMMQSWQGIEPGSLGETLLEFACGLQPTQELVETEAEEP